jgi:hypothetical protein
MKKFFGAIYNFIVGDDWLGAAIVAAGFAGTFGLVKDQVRAFWLVPAAVLVSTTVSLIRIVRARRKTGT